MNFHFVDRIIMLEAGKKTIGLKHVTAHDNYLKRNLQGEMTLMSCIVGEAVGQLAAWCIMSESNFSLRPVAGIAGEIHVLGEALVGDTILLTATIDSWDEQAVQYQGMASVRGKPILTQQYAAAPFLPLVDFCDEAQMRRHFEWIYKPQDYAEMPVGQPIANPYAIYPMTCDAVVSVNRGKSMTAQKNIPIIAPFFSDHFPRKPVFPMSLLLECKIDLMTRFLNDMLGRAPDIQSLTLLNVKMSQFIAPGETVLIKLHCKEQRDGFCRLQFFAEVKGRRVCVAGVECHYA